MSETRPASGPLAPSPRLTKLELLGFKSFASRTVFGFEPGITAVVGPNGSGKSNIADAVRWVLGEQGHGALRAKRTEDVIFAGGAGRAPAGLAEVTLTFDNSDRWLPIDFAEVTVARRAFRAGDNHYLINGRRVRLKDVAQLVASLGQSHVVVGQGLVDAALSQRAEERRGLFEHAADLAGLRLKIAESERSLAETEVNTTRLTDLLDELAPRLRTLERAARQAREWQGLHTRLQEIQHAHFGHLLRRAQHDLELATAVAARDTTAVAAARDTIERLVAEGEEAERHVAAARSALAIYEADRLSLDERGRRVSHERDLAHERLLALNRRRDDMTDTQNALEAQTASLTSEMNRLRRDLQTLTGEIEQARAAVASAQSARATARQERTALDHQVATLTKRLAAHAQAATDLDRQHALLQQRADSSAAERQRLVATSDQRATRLTSLRQELAQAAARVERGTAERRQLETELAQLTAARERAVSDAGKAAAAVTEIAEKLSHAKTRLDLLHRLHESGTGLHAGVRETVAEAKAGTLRGVCGTIAELIAVPAALDTAIEVALGSHLQDIVVDRWADAESAIEHLQRTGAGRATFQPIETVGTSARAGATSRPAPAAALALPGTRGIAAALVQSETPLTGIVEVLLGRVLVVDDLATARAAIPLLPSGWSAVTLTGEIARSSGSVSGGTAVRESGVLGRGRELRSLPATIERLTARHEAARLQQEEAAVVAHDIESNRLATTTTLAARKATAAEREAQHQRLAVWLNELAAEQTAADQRLATLTGTATAATRDLATLRGEMKTRQGETEAIRSELHAATAANSQAATSTATVERALAEAERHLTALEERLRAERKREAGLRARQQALSDELTVRGARAAELEAERAKLATTHTRLVAEAATLDRERSARAAERTPLQTAIRQAETRSSHLARSLATARTTGLERERALGASELAVDRARGERDALRRRIHEELDAVDPDQLLSSAGDAGDGMPAEEREREINRLRERLRRVGYVG
ncbi:MAG: AAA family ATPase, partial [Chloroflexota bacterium]|nr:AAA family ATPase [Chloroflexota bacterium]